MSDHPNLLPATTKKSFHLNVKDPLVDLLEDFCYQALQIPVGTVVNYERQIDLDAFWVTVVTGYRFSVTGQELEHFHAGKTICVPGRDEKIYDQ